MTKFTVGHQMTTLTAVQALTTEKVTMEKIGCSVEEARTFCMVTEVMMTLMEELEMTGSMEEKVMTTSLVVKAMTTSMEDQATIKFKAATETTS